MKATIDVPSHWVFRSAVSTLLYDAALGMLAKLEKTGGEKNQPYPRFTNVPLGRWI